MTANRRSADVKSPDGKLTAWLAAERPYGPTLLFAAADPTAARAISRMPVSHFHWTADSRALWVVGTDGVDEPVGRLALDGRFEAISKGPAMRWQTGLAAAGDTLAWTESDGAHFGAIWLRDRSGAVRLLYDPNPQAAKANPGTQEVVRWKNAHGEDLVGVLAKPAGAGPFPLIVDPYSSWRNRFLNVTSCGNYIFVKEGFAVFFPDHRAPHGFPENFFGESYVGAAKSRDPVDVLTDDVLSGVDDLIRRGIADPARLYLYGTSSGASSIAQLLTQTTRFRAAVAHAGVIDWIGHYRFNFAARGDQTIPGIFGGRTPDTDPDLFRRVSPIYHPDAIKTPLLLVVGDKDQPRYDSNQAFYEALQKAGAPARLVVLKGEAHTFSTPEIAEKHVRDALAFFKTH